MLLVPFGAPDINFMFMSYSDIKYCFWPPGFWIFMQITVFCVSRISPESTNFRRRFTPPNKMNIMWVPGHKLYVYVIFINYLSFLATRILDFEATPCILHVQHPQKIRRRFAPPDEMDISGFPDIKFMFMSYSDIKYYSWRPVLEAPRIVFGTSRVPGHKVYVYVIFGYYLLILVWPEGSRQRPGSPT